ncbi:MAG: purine-binding chemotaxis protein CheW [Clostridiaceae bacterium]|nr:purine-binding chemotaxis protein CheW [Clostridiaceae bacterium]
MYKGRGDLMSMQFVIFKIEAEEFGVDIMKVKEIIKPLQIVRVPNTPVFIEGIINLRGKVHPVFNLRKKFGFPEKPFDDDTKIVIVDVNGVDIGFIVDEVNEIVRIEEDQIEEAPRFISGVNSQYISGVGKIDSRMIIILDLDLVLSVDEQEQLKAVNKS